MPSTKQSKNRWTIGVDSYFRVVGYNHENADMDRPNGEIIREVFVLQAINERGDRRLTGWFDSPESAEEAIESAPPVTLWHDSQPVYGSIAWQEYGEANDIESEARHEEALSWGFDTRFSIF